MLDKDRIYLSVHMRDDNMLFTNDITTEYKDNGLFVSGSNRTHFGLQSGNFMTTFRWNHIFTNRLFSNTTLSYSSYRDSFIKKNYSKRTYNEKALVIVLCVGWQVYRASIENPAEVVKSE